MKHSASSEATERDEESVEDEPYKQSVLDVLRSGYSINESARCTRIFYAGQIKNESQKQAILDVHKDFINNYQDSKSITGALIFINNMFFFHCIEVPSFETIEPLFKTLLTDSNIMQSRLSINQQRGSRTQTHSKYNRTRTSMLQPIAPSHQTSIDENTSISGGTPYNNNARVSISNISKNISNTNPKPLIDNPIGQSGIKCKICNICEEIVREFPIWSFREVIMQSDITQESNKKSSDNNNSKINKIDNTNIDDEEEDLKALESQEEHLLQIIMESIKAMIQIGRQLCMKQDQDAAIKLFSSSQREIITRFPKPEKLDMIMSSKFLFSLKDFFNEFFMPINVKLESEYTWPVQPMIKF